MRANFFPVLFLVVSSFCIVATAMRSFETLAQFAEECRQIEEVTGAIQGIDLARQSLRLAEKESEKLEALHELGEALGTLSDLPWWKVIEKRSLDDEDQAINMNFVAAVNIRKLKQLSDSLQGLSEPTGQGDESLQELNQRMESVKSVCHSSLYLRSGSIVGWAILGLVISFVIAAAMDSTRA
jgi:hypothetical protein